MAGTPYGYLAVPIADRWITTPEAVDYDQADEVIGGPAGAPESGTPA